MSNDFSVKKPKDMTRVNAGDFGELLWWSYYFGTSPEHLLSVVNRFGNLVEDIRKHLENK